MKPYHEALRLWAAHRFGIPEEELHSATIEGIPGDDGHVAVTLQPYYDDDLLDGWRSGTRSIEASLPEVVYEVVGHGLEGWTP